MEKRNKRIVIIAAALIAVVTAAIIGAMAIQATPANRLKASLRLAEKYYSEMNYEQAIIAYKEAIAIDPKCEAAYLAIADIYTAQGQEQEAVRVLEEAANIIQTDAVKVKLEEARKQADAVKRAQQSDNGQQGTRPSAEKPTESPTKPAEEPTLQETQPAQAETQAPAAVQAGTRPAETQPPTESLTQPAQEQKTQPSVPSVTEIPTLPAAETSADVTSGDDTGNDNKDSDDSDDSDNGRGDEDVTEAPTQKPTEAPTQKPTQPPTEAPTETPTQKPTEKPTETPTTPSVSDIKNANVGDIVTFGTYEQDNNTGNGAEPIEWLVLDNQGDRMLVISRYGLDSQEYNERRTSVTWETCGLRSWLNSEFYNTAFSDSEKALIRTTTLSNPDNAKYNTSGGNATNDNVFCLSIDEAKAYFGADSKDSNGNTINKARATKPTAYAVAMGAWTSSSTEWYGGNCEWRLRSPGDFQDSAAFVSTFGYVYEYGGYVDNARSAVRPAMWIDPAQTETPTTPSVSDIKNANTGDIITFGTYEQDNNTGNGAEPIEWLVLDNQGDRMLVISRYGLDSQEYNERRTSVTWETCGLRSWLNSEFYNTAFSDSEKALIRTTTLSNPDNAKYNTSGGNATNDNVFCLSIDEAKAYFGADSKDSNGNTINKARATKPTAYAVAMGAWTSSSTEWYGGNCEWWLRSPGVDQGYAAGVGYYGNVFEYGFRVYYVTYAVRPALWIGL